MPACVCDVGGRSLGQASLLSPEKEEVVGSSGSSRRSRFLSAHLPLSVLTPSPVPTIVWRRADGKPIARKARRHQSDGILEIPNFQQEDAGLYECVAENSRGKNVARGQLTFYGEFRGACVVLESRRWGLPLGFGEGPCKTSACC